MPSKLAISALVVASLFGATAIASAQTDPAQPAPAASAKANGAGSKMNYSSQNSQNDVEPQELQVFSRPDGQVEARR
jgi:hypothetical protein